jgi:AcrR family transcriptional regulator
MPKISLARKDERRRQILLAATTCFARKGFHATTILDICAEAGLSAGAVYSYFDSKDGILNALAQSGRTLADRRQLAADAQTDPLERLKAFLMELALPGNAKINQFDLRSWAEAIGNRQLRDIYLEARGGTIDALTGLVAPLATGETTPNDIAELVLAVIVGCETRRAIQPNADVAPVVNALVALLDGGRQP